MATPTQSSVMYYPGYSQETVTENFVWQVITSITQASQMVITTAKRHNYVAGVKIRFNIPGIFGMQQLNTLQVQVISVTANTLTCNVDSSNFTPFAYPISLPSAYTPPVLIPDSSGPYLPPIPLPYGNQDSFEGVIYNDGQPGNLINKDLLSP
jgi:hypothetical protein